MVQKNVIPFRKRLLPVRPAWRRRRAFALGPTQLLVAATVLSLAGLAALRALDGTRFVDAAASSASVHVAWVDGDSGTINGREFRLHGVDAPEGSLARAGCAHERVLAERSKEAARRLTYGQTIVVRGRHGRDRYDRELVDLSIGGRDVAGALLASGHLKPWNFERGDAAPEWCD